MANRWASRLLRRGDGGRRARNSQGERDDQAVAGELRGLDPVDREIVERSLPHTMTGVMRLRAIVDAVRYCAAAELPGAFAECGVWRGGSVLAMISTLQSIGLDDRDIYLYDTFAGMTEPSEHDLSELEPPALRTWQAAERDGVRAWSSLFDPESFSEDAVRELLLATGYPPERLHFVRGAVEQTLPNRAPGELALLRLDTDWYQSTRHELRHLYPALVRGGVLIIDDYGHWAGARRAVDEYFAEHGVRPLLTAVDYTARVSVKV